MNDELKILLTAGVDTAKSASEINTAIKKIQNQLIKLDIKLDIDTNVFNDLRKQLKELQDSLKFDLKFNNDIKNVSNTLKSINAEAKESLNIRKEEERVISRTNDQLRQKKKLTDEEKFDNIRQYQQREFELKASKFNSKYEGFYDEAELKKVLNIQERLNRLVKDGSYNWEKIRNEIKNSNQQLRIIENSARLTKNEFEEMYLFSNKMADGVKRYATQFAVWETMALGQFAIRDMVQNVIELDDAMIQLKKVTDETSLTYENFQQTAFDMSGQLGVSTKEFIDASSEWARTGASIEDITNNLAKASTVYSKVGDNIDTVTATQVLVSTMQGFNIEAEKSMEIVDVLNNLSNKYAVSSDGLGEALKRSASSMNIANTSLEETVSLATTAHIVVQDASQIGNALKTMSMRMRGVKDLDGELVPNLEGLVKDIAGVDMRDATGEMRSIYDILYDISLVFNDLDSLEQGLLIEKLAGKHRGNVMSAILSNSETLKKTLDDAMDSSGSAMEEHAKQMESITSHINQLKVAWEQLSANTLSSDFVIGIVDMTTALVKLIDKIGVANIAFAGLFTTIYRGSQNGFTASLFNELGFGLSKVAKEADGATVSINKMARAGKVAGGILKGFGVGIIASFAFDGAIAVFDKIYTSLKEQEEKVESVSTEYDNLKNQIRELESVELKTESEKERLSILKQQLDIREKQLMVEKEKEANIAMKNGILRTSLGFQSEDESKKANNTISDSSSARSKFDVQAKSAENLRQKIDELDKTSSSYSQTLNFYERQLSKTVGNMDKYKSEIESVKEELISQKDTLLSVKEELSSKGEYATGSDKEKYENALKLVDSTLDQIDTEIILQDVILGVKEKTDDLTKSTNKLTDANEQASVSAGDINNALKNLEKGFKILDSAQKEYKETGELSISTLQDIIAQYPVLENAIADYNMGLITEKELLEDLSRVYNSDMEAYSQLIQSKMGNSEEYYKKLLSSNNEAISSLANQYAVDADNCRTLNELKTNISDNAFAHFKMANASVFSNFKQAYEVDLYNFNSLMKAKAEAIAQMSKMVGGMSMTAPDSNGLDPREYQSSPAYKMYTQMVILEQQLKDSFKGFDDFAGTTANFKSPSGNTSGGGSNKGGSGSSSKSDYAKWVDNNLLGFLKELEEAEKQILNKIDEVNSNIDNALLVGDNETATRLQNELTDYYLEQLSINKEMVSKINNEVKYYSNVLAKNQYKALEGIDIEHITEKQLDDIMYQYELKINNAKGNEKLQSSLEYERDKVEYFLSSIIEMKEKSADASVKAIELENKALEENIKLIEQKHQKTRDEYDRETAKLSQSQILMDEDSADYYKVERQKYDLILKSQEDVANEINELRKKGLLDTSDEIMSLKKQWSDYETDRLNMIADAKKKEKQLKESLEKDIQNALLDAIKDGVDKRKKELDKELSQYNKAIDDVMKKMDREDATKDYEEQEKEQSDTILSIQEEINKYKLASASGDAEAKLKVAELERQLAEEQKKLEKMQYDREQDLRKDSLNDMKDKAEEETEKAKEELDNQYEDKKEQIENMTGLVDMSHAEWTAIIENFYSDIGVSADGYKNKLQELQTETNKLSNMSNNLGLTVDGNKGDSDKYNPDKNEKPLTFEQQLTKEQANEAKYLKELAIQAQRENNQGLASFVKTERAKWNISADGTIGDIAGIDEKVKKAIKDKYGYYRGGETSGTGWHWLDGEPNRPERILSPEQTKSFNKLVDYAPTLTKYMENLFNNINGGNGTTVELKVENLVNIEGNVSDNKTIGKITNATNEVLTNIGNALSRKGLRFS